MSTFHFLAALCKSHFIVGRSFPLRGSLIQFVLILKLTNDSIFTSSFPSAAAACCQVVCVATPGGLPACAGAEQPPRSTTLWAPDVILTLNRGCALLGKKERRSRPGPFSSVGEF